MEKLVRKTSEITIEVNDDGEYIKVNLADQEFPRRFYGLFENVRKHYEEMKEDSKVKDLKPDEVMDAEIAMSKSVMADIDNMFGEGACRKIFGDIVPDVYAITEFFEALIPILKKYGEQRNNEIRGKYSANRRGGR